jgi:hypothetical protein
MTAAEPACWECHVELRILGFDGPPEAISTALGVEPTRSWMANDPAVKGPLRRRNGWILKSSLPVETEPAEQVTSILRRLPKGLLGLSSIKGGWNASVLCAVYLASGTPPLFFEPSTLATIAGLGAALDIDLYVLPDPADIGTARGS